MYQRLFEHLLAEHGLTLLESEMSEIVNKVKLDLEIRMPGDKVNPFEVYTEMNKQDAKNGSQMLMLSPYFLRAQKTNQGGEVTMGIDGKAFIQLMADEVKCALLVYSIDDFKIIEKKIQNGIL